jgi:Zn-dependent protease with chaperone function
MGKEEAEAVLGHEVSHVTSGDMVTNISAYSPCALAV